VSSEALVVLDNLAYLAPGVTQDHRGLWGGLVSRVHLVSKDGLDILDDQVNVSPR